MRKNITKIKTVLRLSTCGSVDDGKSTLIGRILMDTKSIHRDQFMSLEQLKETAGDENINLALITDGLKEERLKGITIDVAYRYFSTDRRKYIIADTPGHKEYTRNMVTGAANSDVSIILIDAQVGVTDQTRLHAVITSLLRVPHVIVCINKMDAINYSEDKFLSIKQDMSNYLKLLGILNEIVIPISALEGENVSKKSISMPWYKDKALIDILDEFEVKMLDNSMADLRLPIQGVITFNKEQLLLGRIISGKMSIGDKIMILPHEEIIEIKKLSIGHTELREAVIGQSITMSCDSNIKVSRGDMICSPELMPTNTLEHNAMIVWFDSINNLREGSDYIIQHTTHKTKVKISNIDYVLDTISLNKKKEIKVQCNEVARVSFQTEQPLYIDSYMTNRSSGSAILIDAATNNTVAIAMFE